MVEHAYCLLHDFLIRVSFVIVGFDNVYKSLFEIFFEKYTVLLSILFAVHQLQEFSFEQYWNWNMVLL